MLSLSDKAIELLSEQIHKQLKERAITEYLISEISARTSNKISKDELRVEIAVLLFHKNKLTMGQASRFAGMSRISFQDLLGERKIPVHYDIDDLKSDIEESRKNKSKEGEYR
jgi:predicted HTH domain antitoxin